MIERFLKILVATEMVTGDDFDQPSIEALHLPYVGEHLLDPHRAGLVQLRQEAAR